MSDTHENPVASFKLTFDDETVPVDIEFHFGENAEQFFDVGSFVEMSANAILAVLKGGIDADK